MLEFPGKDITIRDRMAQQKVASKQSTKNSTQQKTAQQSPEKVESSEEIVLTSKARNIHQAQKAVKTAPEVRAEKVNRIKKEIADGRFNVDNNKLAEKILEDIIREHNFLN